MRSSSNWSANAGTSTFIRYSITQLIHTPFLQTPAERVAATLPTVHVSDAPEHEREAYLWETPDPQDLQGPDDPPHEGLHTFRNARARVHQQIRDRQRSRLSGFFWYLYHVMTLWTIPNHLTEWEIRRLQKVGPKRLPEVMQQWSEPLPKAQWAKPSEELVRMSAQVRALHKRQPRRPITEIFAEVQRLNPTDKRRA